VLFMNGFDLTHASSSFTRAGTPNRLALAFVVDNLREWADDHSDGWAFWPAPTRAAKQAMTLIQSTTNAANNEQEAHDITDAQMMAAVKPIKAFLTRQGATAEARERILRATLS